MILGLLPAGMSPRGVTSALRSATLAMVLLAGAGAVQAAELIMFERAGCVWCQRWEQDIGAIYPKTDEGRRAPLRKVSLDRALPPDIKIDPPAFYTPTFVLMDQGREIGRITGYIGDDAFWGLLSKMIRALPGP